jgi:type IV secretory pathway VirB2 component (pilin)
MRSTLCRRSLRGGRRVLVKASGALAALLAFLALVFAQSPWERAASNLQATGPLARSLALVAIVIGRLMFMFGEGGVKRQISGIVLGGGLAPFAVPGHLITHSPGRP